MAVFSTNQNRQFYVANSYAKDAVNEKAAAGAIDVGSVDNGVSKELFFKYKGADTVLRSDLIPVKNIEYIKAVAAKDMAVALKQYTVALSADVNGGAPVSGQDYILRIAFHQFYGMSDEDQYFKDAAVHGVKDMTAEDFYKKMVDSLNLCFAREIGSYKDEDGWHNKYLKFEASASGITITELPQEWTLGTQKQEPVMFNVYPTTILVDGEDMVWGTVTDTTPKKADLVTTGGSANAIGNGKKIADLEWFCMGERGDQYRGINWPNNIPTTYLVDPDKEYSTLEIHYAFTDTGVSSYKSEKEITIVSADVAVINSIVSAINTAAGLSVKTLATE